MQPLTKPLSVRQTQLVWGIGLIFAIVCVVLGAVTRKPFDGALNWKHWLLIALVAWTAFGGLSVSRRLSRRTISQSNRVDPTTPDKTRLTSQLVGIVSAEGIVLWALVSNVVIASPQWLSDVIYTAGILLMFRFIPRNLSKNL